MKNRTGRYITYGLIFISLVFISNYLDRSIGPKIFYPIISLVFISIAVIKFICLKTNHFVSLKSYNWQALILFLIIGLYFLQKFYANEYLINYFYISLSYVFISLVVFTRFLYFGKDFVLIPHLSYTFIKKSEIEKIVYNNNELIISTKGKEYKCIASKSERPKIESIIRNLYK